jgi:phage terminase large subunit GpA-like protein
VLYGLVFPQPVSIDTYFQEFSMSATHKINTAMRNAIINVRVMRSAEKAENTEASKACINYLMNAEKKGSGVINRPDWNANLSFKTAKLLHAPLFTNGNDKNGNALPWNFHQGKNNAYDCMVMG